MPIFGVMRLTFERDGGSIRGDEDFFSVARTIPFVAEEKVSLEPDWYSNLNYSPPLIPSAVTPWLTAFKAYSEKRELASSSSKKTVRLESAAKRNRLGRRTYLNQLPTEKS
jgi:hypothetical protein